MNCTCKKERSKRINSSWLSVLGAFFIALLPKCPFCILAYSSAITLCSGKTLYCHDPIWSSYISIFLALFTLLIVLYNYKGTKTLMAALLVIIGSCFLFLSEIYTGEMYHYYIGTSFLMLGVWLNAECRQLKGFLGVKFVFRFQIPRM